MSTHTATVSWELGDGEFTPAAYPRDHHWRLAGGQTLNASAAPGYRGNADCVDPEEAFTASLSSCHMLTFLYLAASKGLVVEKYLDQAEGTLGKTERGMVMTRVTLRPEITFSGPAPSQEDLDQLHHAAHKACFIANSVLTEIVVEAPQAR
ncbi:MAG: OsmC family protein [Pseudomonadota bacterium]